MKQRVETLVAPPVICGTADVELAHRVMRDHLACRKDRCAWKLAAFHTLAVFGRIAPQTLSPRERAAERGIPFPLQRDDHALSESGPAPHTFQQVLEMLNQLAAPPESAQEGGPTRTGV